MFEAYDSYRNMESVFGNYYEQLTAIIQKETLTVRGKEYPTRVFIFGDTEYLCKTFGHMWPSSSYPCLWCTVLRLWCTIPQGQHVDPKQQMAEKQN